MVATQLHLSLMQSVTEDVVGSGNRDPARERGGLQLQFVAHAAHLEKPPEQLARGVPRAAASLIVGTVDAPEANTAPTCRECGSTGRPRPGNSVDGWRMTSLTARARGGCPPRTVADSHQSTARYSTRGRCLQACAGATDRSLDPLAAEGWSHGTALRRPWGQF
jgi:hypothetical protein